MAVQMWKDDDSIMVEAKRVKGHLASGYSFDKEKPKKEKPKKESQENLKLGDN